MPLDGERKGDVELPALKRDLLNGMDAATRKTYPVATGFMGYFRDAIFRVAHVSYVGNAQHNPGQETHWARGKSTDQMDCAARHTMEALDLNDMSDATEEALASMAWRSLAQLQLFLEKRHSIKPPPSCK
jgi:hypothetical protein